jgi:hypothetical protein
MGKYFRCESDRKFCVVPVHYITTPLPQKNNRNSLDRCFRITICKAILLFFVWSLGVSHAQTSTKTEFAQRNSVLSTWAQSLPRIAVGTNILYDGWFLTPNLSLEIGITTRNVVRLSGSYNGWNLAGSESNNKKLVHSLFRAGYRYYLCERYNGHFFGANAIFTRYNIGEQKLFGLLDPAYRYDGIGYGGELTYGYHFILGNHWGIEASLGVGILRFNYDKYPCEKCSRDYTKAKKTWMGPTDAAISLIYLL